MTARGFVLAAWLALAPASAWAQAPAGGAPALQPAIVLNLGADPLPAGVRVSGAEPRVVRTGRGRAVSSHLETDGQPFALHVDLPEGDYRVDITFAPGADAVVRAEARRLMLEGVRTGREARTESFVVNVRQPALPPPQTPDPVIPAVRLKPAEAGNPDWDGALTLEFAGPAPRIDAVTITPVAVTRLFLLGDSTVADQPGEPYASWGQMLPRFLGPGLSVANHAQSGETIKSFHSEGRLDKVLSQMRPGDWALIQFGHNDQKTSRPQTYAEAGTTWNAWLKVLVAEIRRRGAHPVLVTSVERRRFDAAGRIVPSHGAYPDAVRQVGAETGIPVLDLWARSIEIYEALGTDKAKLAFARKGEDATHHNDYGAWLLARSVIAEMQALRLSPARFAASDLPPFDSRDPLPPERFTLPASGTGPADKPAGN